jgi:hypothetical protein
MLKVPVVYRLLAGDSFKDFEDNLTAACNSDPAGNIQPVWWHTLWLY